MRPRLQLQTHTHTDMHKDRHTYTLTLTQKDIYAFTQRREGGRGREGDTHREACIYTSYAYKHIQRDTYTHKYKGISIDTQRTYT